MTDDDDHVERLVADYASAWNCDDASARSALLTRIWEPTGVFDDPMGTRTGVQALGDHIGRIRARTRGMHLAVTSGPERDGDQVVFGWEIVVPGRGDGARPRPVVSGRDRLRLGPGGRVAALAGEWDEGPARARRRRARGVS